jgi:hypothetical protein
MTTMETELTTITELSRSNCVRVKDLYDKVKTNLNMGQRRFYDVCNGNGRPKNIKKFADEVATALNVDSKIIVEILINQ